MKFATMMFKTIWEKNLADAQNRQKAAQQKLNALETRVKALVNRIVKATQPALINAYEGELIKLESQRLAAEEQIEHLESQKGHESPDFEGAYRTAMRFLSNPCYL
ncbi:hypothetical protein [Litorimonas taeanensis]|uniref:hypothetical protein n=1 Tax=Litorimonas taeanensis TaxID=568099 RepID=UPI0011C3A6A0|nr:hypothetical protein [Litorimonas taeanensis]